MPTVLRIDGWRFVVYPNDHTPAHVHVIGPGWVVVVNLLELQVRETMGCTESDARRVMRLVDDHQAELMRAWKRYHG